VTGSGDLERLELETEEYMVSPVWNLGVGNHARITVNKYRSGNTPTIKYRQGATEEDCLAASFEDYTGSFYSLGYVQVRIEE